jgi:hypothetical protein
MIYDPIRERKVQAIPKSLKEEWNYYASGINEEEHTAIISWINEKFDEVATRSERVQPSGWLGSGFKWQGTPLSPIYRECKKLLSGSKENEIQEKAGQIFGLYISLALANHREERWLYVKSDKYKAHGVPIKSRIYFLSND